MTLDARLLAIKAIRGIRRMGLRKFTAEGLKHLVHRTRPDEFDLRNGTDTGSTVPLWRFKIPFASARFGVAYQSPQEVTIREALANIPRHTTLLDLGCGKGRVLIVGARMEFQRVVGVEFVAELADIARHNLVITGTKAEVVYGDAGDYLFPEGPLCVYFYNPFSVEIMGKVAKQLESRRAESWVVYINPRANPGCAELFDAFMHRVSEGPGPAIWHLGEEEKLGQAASSVTSSQRVL
jgi:protein-L-isoaspartate O-methyltransferase